MSAEGELDVQEHDENEEDDDTGELGEDEEDEEAEDEEVDEDDEDDHGKDEVCDILFCGLRGSGFSGQMQKTVVLVHVGQALFLPQRASHEAKQQPGAGFGHVLLPSHPSSSCLEVLDVLCRCVFLNLTSYVCTYFFAGG